ncbi:MAG: hypothetical protein JOZ90_03290 [Alphaproteobacteria bacterium]|nr:hypothetical protein [Alphaproteobacteria bacterium]MBV9370816.1 hypothetical protein [Alphaproteobacteria bacterium]MBV9900104.1 hypothetical protein [Alphaproteobacteria bacterium]
MPGHGALPTLVETILPAVRESGALDAQACYFDRLLADGTERLRLSFAPGDAGERALALLSERLEAQGRHAPYRVIHSPGRMLSELVTGPKAGEVFERFSRRTAPLLFGWLEDFADGRARLPSLAFDLLAIQILSRADPAAAPGKRPAYPRSFLTYRSHADGFFIMARRPDEARAAVEARYARVALASQARLRALQEAVNADALPPELAAWRAAMSTMLREVREAIDEGAIYFSAGTGYLGDQNDLSESQFHQKIQSSFGFQSFMRFNHAFLATRLTMGLLYLSLRRLGLPILDRYFLCHAVARSVEDVYQLDPVAELHEFLVESLTPKWWGGIVLQPLVRFAVRYLPRL